jgi:hypothetical protein
MRPDVGTVSERRRGPAAHAAFGRGRQEWACKRDRKAYLHRKAELHELELDLAFLLVIQDILAWLLASCTFRRVRKK